MMLLVKEFGENEVDVPFVGNLSLVCDQTYLYLYGEYFGRSDSAPHDRLNLWRCTLIEMRWTMLEVRGKPDQVPFLMRLFKKRKDCNKCENFLFVFVSEVNGNLCDVCKLDLNQNDNLNFERIDATGQKPPYPRNNDHDIIYKNENGDHFFYFVATNFRDGKYFMDIHQFNIETYVWREIYAGENDEDERAPLPRIGLRLAISNESRLLIFGRETSGTESDFERVPYYDLEDNNWGVMVTNGDDKEGFPNTRSHHQVIKLERKFVMFGGFVRKDDERKNCWTLDEVSQTWRRVQDLQLNVSLLAKDTVTTPRGQICTFGNLIGWGKIKCIYSEWTVIPDLMYLAMQARNKV